MTQSGLSHESGVLDNPDRFLDQGMRLFIVNKAKREYWRVAGVLDLEDLIQEGYICYYKCYRRYSNVANRDVAKELTASWLQALVARAFTNRIYDLASKKKHGWAVPASEVASVEESPEDFLDRYLPHGEGPTALGAILAQAPWELVELLKVLAGIGTMPLQFNRQRRRGRRETTNEYYCRMLGVDPNERNLVDELKLHFD